MNILYVHDFASSSNDSYYKAIKNLITDERLFAFDISIHPFAAIGYIKNLTLKYNIDVIIAVGVGAFYSSFISPCLNVHKIYINPVYNAYEHLKEKHELNHAYPYTSPRYNHESSYKYTDGLEFDYKNVQEDFILDLANTFTIECNSEHTPDLLDQIQKLKDSSDKSDAFIKEREKSACFFDQPYILGSKPDSYHPYITAKNLSKYYGIPVPKEEFDKQGSPFDIFEIDTYFSKYSTFIQFVKRVLNEKSYTDSKFIHHITHAVTTSGIIGVDNEDALNLLLDADTYGYQIQKFRDTISECSFTLNSCRNIFVSFVGSEYTKLKNVDFIIRQIKKTNPNAFLIYSCTIDLNMEKNMHEIVYLYSNYDNMDNLSEGDMALLEQKEKLEKEYEAKLSFHQ